MKKLFVLAFALALAPMSAACGGEEPVVKFEDDVDLVLDFGFSRDHEMHSPYVQGASMTVRLSSTDDKHKFDGWTIQSTDPAVFSITETKVEFNVPRVTGRALKEGRSRLIAKDPKGNVGASYDVEVVMPNRVDLLAHGQMLIGRSADEARVVEPRIRVAGTATFLARYSRDGRQLHGNGALAIRDSGIGARVERTFVFEDRDWVKITPPKAGSFALDLDVGGKTVSTMAVHVVEDEGIASVRITGADESKAEEGKWLTISGEAFDAARQPVFGVDFQWDLDGVAQRGAGDLFRYEFRRGAIKTLTARAAGKQASVQIQAGEGKVASSNEVGCTTAPGRAGATTAGLLAIAVGLALVSRRRR